MIVGIDFDNTIACYEGVFHKVALEKDLIPVTTGYSKNDVRDSMHARSMHDEWTALQGCVYGGRMNEVTPFEGVKEFMKMLHKQNIPFYIISHKTRFSKKGKRYDLHKAASDWLENNGFFSIENGLLAEYVFFNSTRQEKIQRIKDCRCTHFIDDLPEVFAEANFPTDVKKILFSPGNVYKDKNFVSYKRWKDITESFFDEK